MQINLKLLEYYYFSLSTFTFNSMLLVVSLSYLLNLLAISELKLFQNKSHTIFFPNVVQLYVIWVRVHFLENYSTVPTITVLLSWVIHVHKNPCVRHSPTQSVLCRWKKLSFMRDKQGRLDWNNLAKCSWECFFE